MKIGFLVEGPTEREVIPMLVHKILAGSGKKVHLVSPRVVSQGDLLNAHKIKAYVEKDLLLEHPDLSKTVICRDSECTDPKLIEKDFQTVEQELERLGVKIPITHCVVVHALEGWLMADAQTLREFLNVKSLRIKKAESICKPKDELKEIFRKARRNYLPTHDNVRLAKLVNVNHVAQGNSSFAKFRALITES